MYAKLNCLYEKQVPSANSSEKPLFYYTRIFWFRFMRKLGTTFGSSFIWYFVIYMLKKDTVCL